MRLLLSFILTAFLFDSAYAAVSSKSMRKNLKAHSKELSAITKEIFALESNLGKGNRRYLRTLNSRKGLEEKILVLKTRIQKQEERIESKRVLTEKRMKQVLVQAMNPVKDPAQLLSLRVTSKMLKEEIQELKRIKSKTTNIKKTLETSNSEYQRLRQVESDLLSLMNEMEDSKRSKSLRYVELKKKKDSLQGKLKLRKAKKYTKSKKKKSKLIAERFMNPIDTFSDMEYGKKGITYKYNKRQAVKVSRAGKVIHAGSLSTYGNVVMVDHGNDVRSIFLGQFSPSVKKGDSVVAGTILGTTFDVARNEGKLYFEVRKKNKAQNTVLLLDKNSTSKKSNRRRI